MVSLDLHPITKLRCDADCLFLFTKPHPQRRGRPRKYDGKVNFQDLSRFEDLGTLEEAQAVHLYPAVVWHVSLKRRLRVVVLVNRKDPAKPRYIVFRRIWNWTAASWSSFTWRVSGSSSFFATANSSPDSRTVKHALRRRSIFHFNASLAALNLARAEQLLASPSQSPQVFSMASWKQRKFNERLLELFIENLALDPTWVKINPVMTNSGLMARLPPDFVRTIDILMPGKLPPRRVFIDERLLPQEPELFKGLEKEDVYLISVSFSKKGSIYYDQPRTLAATFLQRVGQSAERVQPLRMISVSQLFAILWYKTHGSRE